MIGGKSPPLLVSIGPRLPAMPRGPRRSRSSRIIANTGPSPSCCGTVWMPEPVKGRRSGSGRTLRFDGGAANGRNRRNLAVRPRSSEGQESTPSCRSPHQRPSARLCPIPVIAWHRRIRLMGGESCLRLARRIALHYSSGARKRHLLGAGIGGLDRPLA